MVNKHSDDLLPDSYPQLLEELKQQIASARVRAGLAVNRELIGLYWRLGKEILEREESEGWGAKVIDRLSRDLRHSFPEMKGLSRTNLHYMRAFAAAWPEFEIVQQPAGQLPWGHNMVLLDKFNTRDERLFYAQAAIAGGWSRNVLEYHVATNFHLSKGAAATNFQRTLPAADSDLVQQITKDPYNFEFLDQADMAYERRMERGLLADIRRFMLELGFGFAFVGSQYRLEVAGDEFFIDLLFFHIPLNRYVVIDLKVCKFKPGDVGQLNFYITAVDELLRQPHHAATVGLVICPGKNETVVEWALRDVHKPIGVAGFQGGESREEIGLTSEMPEELESKLPSISELQVGLTQIAQQHAEEINEIEGEVTQLVDS